MDSQLQALADKGDGVVQRFDVGRWSYPGAPVEAGAHLRIPLENVPQAAVDEALASGEMVPHRTDERGTVVAVILADRARDRVLTPASAGTVDAV